MPARGKAVAASFFLLSLCVSVHVAHVACFRTAATQPLPIHAWNYKSMRYLHRTARSTQALSLSKRATPQQNSELVLIGKVLKPHGLAGEVKVQVHTDYPEARFAPTASIYLKQPHEERAFETRLESCKLLYSNVFVKTGSQSSSTVAGSGKVAARASKKVREALVRLEGMDPAELQGGELYAKATDRPPGSEDDIMASDVVGMFCIFRDCHPSDCVGIVEGVLLPEDYCTDQSLADDLDPLLEIGRYKNGEWKTFTVPFTPQLISKIYVRGRLLLLRIPQELLDTHGASRSP